MAMYTGADGCDNKVVVLDTGKVNTLRYNDLSEDERRLLLAFRNAPTEAQKWDALAILLNGRRRDGDAKI